MKIKVVSDTHFGHEKLLEFRGFSSVDEMNEAIIDKWNKLMKTGDFNGRNLLLCSQTNRV